MDFYELIRGRESIRNYDPGRPLDEETLYRILEAGRVAPSAVNYQPWRFLLISSPGMLAKVLTSSSWWVTGIKPGSGNMTVTTL